ncbi:MAG TPA: ABC transporter ATP-binding protein [Pseudogracilibacillus sp.]|nr:ABC transporter ATP-binding protein [Pseudogracilibacillus sp.]
MFVLRDVKFLDVLSIKYLEIEEGKVTSIIGESGAGKSTLAKLLNKMITPDSGTVLYQDKDLATYDPIKLRREVVMLSQTPLMFEGTIEENLQIGLQFSEKEPATIEEMKTKLSDMELNKDLKTPINKLSGGEKQRIALARIALMKPNVYILDEPTSALDDLTEDDVIQTFIEHAKSSNQTVIIITHSEILAKTYSDRIITVKRGEIND